MGASKKKQARAAHCAMCSMLEKEGLRFEEKEEGRILFSLRLGQEMYSVSIVVDEMRQIIRINVPLLRIPEERRNSAAALVCTINYMLVDGAFDFDIRDGEITFRVAGSIGDIIIGPKYCKYLFYCAMSSCVQFGRILRDFAAGRLGFEQAMSFIYGHGAE